MFDITLLHPMIVHFPIALLIVGFLFETIGLFVQKEFFSKTGFYLLILGTIGVITAYFTGQSAGDGITEVGTLKQALETHEGAAVAFIVADGRSSFGKNRPCFVEKILWHI